MIPLELFKFGVLKNTGYFYILAEIEEASVRPCYSGLCKLAGEWTVQQPSITVGHAKEWDYHMFGAPPGLEPAFQMIEYRLDPAIVPLEVFSHSKCGLEAPQTYDNPILCHDILGIIKGHGACPPNDISEVAFVTGHGFPIILFNRYSASRSSSYGVKEVALLAVQQSILVVALLMVEVSVKVAALVVVLLCLKVVALLVVEVSMNGVDLVAVLLCIKVVEVSMKEVALLAVRLLILVVAVISGVDE
ncbi:hypothetical protein ACFX11_011516 [Malus domestica]